MRSGKLVGTRSIDKGKGKGVAKGGGKAGANGKVPRNISAALLPSIAFAAVPKTPPPSVSIEDFEPKLTNSLLASSIIGRLYATQDPGPGSDDETTTSMNDYLEEGHPSSLRASGTARGSWKRQSECPYDDPDFFEDESPGHVYAVVKQKPRRPISEAPEEEPIILRRADAPGTTGPWARHRFKQATGLDGPPSRDSRPELPARGMLDNVGTLMTTGKDTQDREDLERIASILRENEEAPPTGEIGSQERLVDSLKRDQREAAIGSSREFQEVDRSAQVSGRMFADQGETERLVRRLNDEVDILKKTIHRLNTELARQMSPRSQSAAGQGVRLPGRGPVPSWLVNMKFLSPLLVAYDEKLDEKDAIITDYDRQMREFEASLKDVIKENERLHIKLEEATANGPTSRSEWQQFLEQAKLVLEENQLLLEQLDVQQEKSKAADREHLTEVSRMSKQVIALESEKEELENELYRLKQRLRDMKARYDQFLNEKEAMEDDTTTEIYKAKKIIDELKTTQESETKEILKKLEVTQAERRAIAEELADSKADRKKQEGEIKGLKKSLKDAHRKNLMLRKFLQKEQSAQEYLESVLQMAHSLAAERDSCLKAMKDKEAEHGKIIQNIVDEVRVKASIEANRKGLEESSSRKGRKAKSLGKLELIVKQLLEQNEDIRNKHKEQEREVIYLQALVKEKEDYIDRVRTEKKHLEDQLESVWQAAVNDNKQLRAQIIDTL